MHACIDTYVITYIRTYVEGYDAPNLFGKSVALRGEEPQSKIETKVEALGDAFEGLSSSSKEIGGEQPTQVNKIL